MECSCSGKSSRLSQPLAFASASVHSWTNLPQRHRHSVPLVPQYLCSHAEGYRRIGALPHRGPTTGHRLCTRRQPPLHRRHIQCEHMDANPRTGMQVAEHWQCSAAICERFRQGAVAMDCGPLCRHPPLPRPLTAEDCFAARTDICHLVRRFLCGRWRRCFV